MTDSGKLALAVVGALLVVFAFFIKERGELAGLLALMLGITFVSVAIHI